MADRHVLDLAAQASGRKILLQFSLCLKKHFRWGCYRVLPRVSMVTEKVPLNLTEVILAQGSMLQASAVLPVRLASRSAIDERYCRWPSLLFHHRAATLR
jgi:hypothetical protein